MHNAQQAVRIGIRAVSLVALVGIMLGVMVGPGAAQTDEPINNSTSSPTTERPDGEQIEPGLWLVDRSLSGGTATVSLVSTQTTPVSVTVTDAGAVFQGGTVAQRDAVVFPSETTTVEIPITRTPSGAAGVTIATPSTLFGVPLDRGFSLSTPVESEWLALGTGVGITLVSALLLKRRRDRIRDNGVVRVDG